MATPLILLSPGPGGQAFFFAETAMAVALQDPDERESVFVLLCESTTYKGLKFQSDRNCCAVIFLHSVGHIFLAQIS